MSSCSAPAAYERPLVVIGLTPQSVLALPKRSRAGGQCVAVDAGAEHHRRHAGDDARQSALVGIRKMQLSGLNPALKGTTWSRSKIDLDSERQVREQACARQSSTQTVTRIEGATRNASQDFLSKPTHWMSIA